jgi:hypothetical protein
MARTKHVSKRKRGTKAIPVLGAAGLLSLAGGASASTGGQVADTQAQNISPNYQITLGEEEMSDVSLSTFYVFDKEKAADEAGSGVKVAWRGCGCGGGCRCGGCRCGGGCGWRGCGCGGGCGCWGGCGCGCCLSWGGCRLC